MARSAVDCVQPAIQHTKEQLFTHFRFSQWLRLALVGILAAEIHTGSCNFGNLGDLGSRSGRNGDDFLSAPPFPLPHIDTARLAQFAGLIAVAVLFALVVYFVLLYLNSIFRFILFDAIVRRECSISAAWDRWHRAGRRFFLWQIVFLVSALVFFGMLIGVPLALAAGAGWLQNPGFHKPGMIGGLILLIGAVILFAIVAAIVQALAKDFLVPIMALEGLDFADGWSRLLTLMRPEVGKYAVYILLKIVLAIAAAIIFTIAAIIPVLLVVLPCVAIGVGAHAAGVGWTVITASLAIIFGALAIMLLIYLVALVSVPATVFFPAFALYFLADRYPALAALLSPTPTPSIAPPIPEMPPPLPSPEPIG